MIAGFTTIPATYADNVQHYIYARPHVSKPKASAKSPEWPEDRTLFVVNLPPDATDREAILFFQRYGVVERVVFDEDRSPVDEDDMMNSEDEDEDADPENPSPVKTALPNIITLPPPAQPLRKHRKTGKTAHVIFLDSSSLSSLPSSTKSLSWPSSSESPSGLAHYAALYQALRPPLDSVKAHVDSYMAHFSAAQARPAASKYKKGEAIVDDDGFTLVTRGGAYGQTLGGGVAVASKKFALGVSSDSQTKRKRKKEKRKKEDEEGFYAFKKADKQRKGVFLCHSYFGIRC